MKKKQPQAKPEPVIALALSSFFFLMGVFAAGFFEPGFKFTLGYGGYLDIMVLCAATFIFSMLSSGYMGSVMLLYFGLISRAALFNSPFGTAIQLTGMLIAAYSGAVFSFYLKNDFEGRDNLFMHLREVAVPLCFAFTLCLAAVFLMPYLPTAKNMSEVIIFLFDM